jgi:hypothetical protein
VNKRAKKLREPISTRDAVIALVGSAALLLACGTIGLVQEDCPTEDSTWCYWDGDKHGSGQGHDVLNLGEGTWIVLGPLELR